MKKLFDWMIEHTRHYMWLHCLYTDMLAINENLKRENKEIKKLLEEAESKLIEIDKIINRYTTAKDIKRYYNVCKGN